MREDIFKKIVLINKSGFFASCLLNIGAMNNISNLKENNLKIENNFDNSFLLETTIKTCKECNDTEKIKIDLTKILKSMEEIFLKVFNDNKYETMKKLAYNLYFKKQETDVLRNIDKFQMLLNLLDDDLFKIIIKHEKYKNFVKKEYFETISEFKEQFKNDNNKTDIVDYLVAEFRKLFTDNYKYKTLSGGCFGLTYKSDEIKTLLVKELRKQPIGIVTSDYDTEEKLRNLKIDEYNNYLEKKDILPDYICKYYINLWSRNVILQMIQGEPYKDLKGYKLSDTVENNIKKIIYINNCFNDLKNKIGYRLIDRHCGNMIECIHRYLCQIDIDINSFSKEEEINSLYFYDLKRLILDNKKGTSFSDLEVKDFDIYEEVLKYYKIYDVDFLHCIINNTYRKSPMFYLSNLINNLVKKNNTYYCNTNNITFIKILKFIDNVNRFKNEINKDKLFTLYSIVYNGNEENYDKDISPLYLTNYKISQNNIDATGYNNNKTIEDFVNEMLKRKNYSLDLNNKYIKSLDKNISLINLNEKTINNFKEFGTIFTGMKHFSIHLNRDFLIYSNNKIKDLLHINDIVDKIVECSNEEDFKENFYDIIFRINENYSFRNLKPDELKQLEYSDKRFLFKNKIVFVNEKIDSETLAKLYDLNERETAILNFYKTSFLEKYLNYMLMFEFNKIKNGSIFNIYYYLHNVFFGFNELLNLKDINLFYLNLFLFPKDIYKNFYNLYLKESANFLYNSYMKELNNFNSINISKVENFDEISINKKFDILDEFLGKEYLFKDLLDEEKYATYLNLQKKRSKKIEELYNKFYETGNGSIIIKDYKNGLVILNEIIDLFLKNYDLDVESRVNAICNNEKYKNFINKYLPWWKNLKDAQTISGFIDILDLILKRLNETLINIDEEHKKDLTDVEIQKKIKNLKSKFFKSSYFIKLLNSFSVKIKKLDIILSKFLKLTDKVEDEDNTYFNVSLNEECVNKIFDNCKEFLNKDEINNGKKINDLYDLKNFLLNCLNNKNIDDYKFDDLENFKEKLKNIYIINKNSSNSDQEEGSSNSDKEEDIDYGYEEEEKNSEDYGYEEEEKNSEDEGD